MDELHVDLRDTRGRLIRLATAVAIGAVITVFAMRWIVSVSDDPNGDPVGGSMVGLVAILVFVLTSVAALGGLVMIQRRRARVTGTPPSHGSRRAARAAAWSRRSRDR